MANHQHIARVPAEYLAHLELQLFFQIIIKRRKWFIQHDHIRLIDENARQRHTLLLIRRKAGTDIFFQALLI